MSSSYTNHHNSPSNGAKGLHTALQQQSSVPGTPTMKRRESLVKPTWHNVCPGEVPADTLEKLNKLTNGERHQLHQLNQHDSILMGDDANPTGNGAGAGSLVGKMGAHRKQVELYDIFGKVNIRRIYFSHFLILIYTYFPNDMEWIVK